VSKLLTGTVCFVKQRVDRLRDSKVYVPIDRLYKLYLRTHPTHINPDNNTYHMCPGLWAQKGLWGQK
jgi:hypothetical protein